MKHNICIIGLLKSHTKSIAKHVADRLNMFYADVIDLLSFDLISLVEARTIVGKDYIDKKEEKKIKEVCSFENTLITLNYLALNKSETLNIVKENCLLIYLDVSHEQYLKKLSKEKLGEGPRQIEEMLKPVREDVLKQYADIVVDVQGTIANATKQILKGISDFYEVR